MLKDRDQKQKALKLAVANRWFPQLEVDVHSDKAVDEDTNLATDLDVFASVPDLFKGFRAVVFDCKTKAKESPVNRAFWLSGVLRRMHADHGFCILKKERLSADHCLMAGRLNIVLLMEDEFDLYATATCPRYAVTSGNTIDITNWDKLFAIPQRATTLELCLRFIRCGYWMIDDPAEACRKTLASLKAHSAEFDPTKPEHIAVFFEYCSLFSRSLAILVCDIFKLYLQPKQQQTLSEALLVMLYGGREAYEHRNDLYRLVLQMKGDGTTQLPDLALPEWDRFLQLTRQLLDAPTESQRVPLIMREVGFSVLAGDSKMEFGKLLCTESPQGARFAVLITDYLARASKLPPEFSKNADNLLLPLQPTK